MSHLHEECGVFGIYNRSELNVVSSTYHALYALQHRGQESCGMAINDDGVITGHKDVGLVNDVFTKEVLERMGRGDIAIGHVRYATDKSNNRRDAQPMIINHVKGSMALAHNGALTNALDLREQLELTGAIFHTTSDTEVIAYTITKARLTTGCVEDAIVQAMEQLDGAYSLVVMSPQKLIAVRDPHGFRPLCIGDLNGSTVFASESCALDSIGATFVRDVEPGEVVVVDKTGMRSIKTHCGKVKSSFCIFEFVYFARPDSVIDGACVHTARQKAGAILAEENPVEADVVIGVPDSGLDAALGYANYSGIPYGVGFMKNRYIGRTFIEPGQKQRENLVRIKLNPVSATVKGKRVILIDDSIVRGTTSPRIVKLLRDAGAKEVHMRISSPPFLNPCYFGTDIDSKEHLMACRHTLKEMEQIIGVDSLRFLSVEGVHKIAEDCNLTFCDGCFTGKYPVEPPAERKVDRYTQKISETASR